MKELIQNRWFKKTKYTITEQALVIETKDFKSEGELAVSYEHLHKTVLSHQEFGHDNLLLGIILIALALFTPKTNLSELVILTPLLFVPGVLLIVYWFSGKRTFWRIKMIDNQYLVLNKEIPNSATVDAFIETLFETRDAYLVREYGIINVDLSYGYQLEHFKRLKRLNVWDENEFNAQCQRLKSIHELSKLGFDFGKFNEN